MTVSELVSPGKSVGLVGVYRQRFLLKLLVRKELKVRYRGSVLGLFWSYIKPAVQFVVFYIALGVFLGLNRNIENYAVYLFSGVVVINFFSEAFGNATRSIVGNGGLIKKIFLPRELFPIASIWVSAVHFFPQMVVLLGACLFTGWVPNLLHLLAAVLVFVVVAFFAAGLGLLFAAVNVFFRDSENIADLILLVATWTSPVLYSWTMVKEAYGELFFMVYQFNPLTVAVEIFHLTFWFPTTNSGESLPPNLLTIWLPVSFLVSVFFLFLGQFVFTKLSGRFAQEL